MKKRKPITHPDWMSPEGRAFRERFAYSPDAATYTPLGFFIAGAEWARREIARARPIVPPRPRAHQIVVDSGPPTPGDMAVARAWAEGRPLTEEEERLVDRGAGLLLETPASTDDSSS
jgi:hypothetical protein